MRFTKADYRLISAVATICWIGAMAAVMCMTIPGCSTTPSPVPTPADNSTQVAAIDYWATLVSETAYLSVPSSHPYLNGICSLVQLNNPGYQKLALDALNGYLASVLKEGTLAQTAQGVFLVASVDALNAKVQATPSLATVMRIAGDVCAGVKAAGG